ncbi:GNAT family N-acetyltransferase [uncultured Ferrimonas sp.]|uniref:GNAT family N-acetyltransferase n=1 Tax=uncultured Ferrimonas sp. TaxID=432640 RepID=UPI002621CA99|nr:GNAT family N-acetyltransferase [uncultured Ferrimonas sp.]
MTSIHDSLSWNWLSFEQLDINRLYGLLQLREQVFQIEQNSLYVDIDGADQQAQHLLVEQSGQLLGYLRVLQPQPQLIKLGRIVVAPSGRGLKLGRKMIEAGIEKAQQLCPQGMIKISAQVTLQGYYQSFGFEVISAAYDDGGVMHQDMQLSLPR